MFIPSIHYAVSIWLSIRPFHIVPTSTNLTIPIVAREFPFSFFCASFPYHVLLYAMPVSQNISYTAFPSLCEFCDKTHSLPKSSKQVSHIPPLAFLGPREYRNLSSHTNERQPQSSRPTGKHTFIASYVENQILPSSILRHQRVSIPPETIPHRERQKMGPCSIGLEYWKRFWISMCFDSVYF